MKKLRKAESLIQEINDWIQETTQDATDGIPDDTRMTRKELETICRAISYAPKRRIRVRSYLGGHRWNRRTS